MTKNRFMYDKTKEQYIQDCNCFLNAVRPKNLVDRLQVTHARISMWRVRGIPEAWAFILSEKFPIEFNKTIGAL